jgi:hypothetical protein
MSFLASFVTGFATQAQKDIEERDKELRDEATMRWNVLLKEREKATLRAEKRKDELETVARQLAAYGQGMLSKEQITAALASGTGEALIETLQKIKTPLTEAQAKSLIKVEPGQELPSPEDYIKEATTLKPGQAATPSPEQMRGAFGLPTRAYEQSLKSASAQTGVSTEDIYRTKLPDSKVFKAVVDLTAVGVEKEKGYDAELSAARLRSARADALFNEASKSGNTAAIDAARAKAQEAQSDLDLLLSKKEGTPKEKIKADPQTAINENVMASIELRTRANNLMMSGDNDSKEEAKKLLQYSKYYDDQANKIYESIPRAKKEGEQPDTFKNLATFRSGFNTVTNNVMRSVQSSIGGTNFVPVTNPDGTQSLMYTGTDPKAWDKIYNARSEQYKAYVQTVAKQTGGRIPPGLTIAASEFGVDITPEGQVTVKRMGKEEGLPQSGTAPAAPGLGARAKPAATAPAAAASAADPIPTKTENGKTVIDGTKLVAGKKYMDPNTKQVKTWNGTRFE